MGSGPALERAEAFLRGHARLLERRSFEALFRGGPREAALTALAAYQNPDGGFGHALHPDLRDPASRPRATVFALRLLDALDAVDAPRVGGALDFLAAAGPASLRPTAESVGVLRRHGVVHPWLDAATDYCWRAAAIYADPPAGLGGEPPEPRALMALLEFLEHAVPCPEEPTRGPALRARIEQLALEWDLVDFDPDARPGQGPLDWAPSPGSPGRRLFTSEQIAVHLEGLAARQQPDGGWVHAGSAATPAAECEWRGVHTLRALRILHSYGALEPGLPEYRAAG